MLWFGGGISAREQAETVKLINDLRKQNADFRRRITVLQEKLKVCQHFFNFIIISQIKISCLNAFFFSWFLLPVSDTIKHQKTKKTTKCKSKEIFFHSFILSFILTYFHSFIHTYLVSFFHSFILTYLLSFLIQLN